MDSDTLQIAARLTAALLPNLELDEQAAEATEQVAATYWTMVKRLVELRKDEERIAVALPELKK
jgi:hypothetical protein